MNIYQIIFNIPPQGMDNMLLFTVHRANFEKLFVVLAVWVIYLNSRFLLNRSKPSGSLTLERDFWPIPLAVLVVSSHAWWLYELLTVKQSSAQFFDEIAVFLYLLWPLQIIACGWLLTRAALRYGWVRHWRYGLSVAAYLAMVYWIVKPLIAFYMMLVRW